MTDLTLRPREASGLWSVVRLLVIAELRAQRLLSRRAWVTATTVLVSVLMLAFLSVGVTTTLMSGTGLPVTNLAVLSVAGLFVSFASARITGENTSSTPAQATAWMATWPLESRRLWWLTLGAHTSKSVLLGGTLLLAVAVGAARAAPDIGAMVQIIGALFFVLVPGALVSMLPPREGDGRIVNMLFLIALAAAFFAVAVPLPVVGEPWAGVVAIIAVPAIALLGGLSPQAAIGAALLWAAFTLVLWLLVRRALTREQPTAAKSAGWLSRAAFRGGFPLAGLVALRLRPVAVVASVTVVIAAVWVTARNAQTLGMQTTLPGPTLVMLAVTACSAGYLVLRSTLRSDAAGTDWLRTLPIRRARVSDIEAMTAGGVAAAATAIAVPILAAPLIPQSGGWILAGMLTATFALVSVEGASRQRSLRGLVVLAAAAALTVLLLVVTVAFHDLVPAWISISTGSALGILLGRIAQLRTRGVV